MTATVGFYAFEPGAPGVPRASGTGVFIASILNSLRTAASIDLRVRWLRPEGPRLDRSDLMEAAVAFRWTVRQLTRMLGDRSRHLVFVYPKVPVLAHVVQPTLLSVAFRAYQLLVAKSWITGQRILVIVEDLPIEMATGRAVAGGPVVDLPADRIRAIERTLFRSAHRLIVPQGFREPIRDRHHVDPARIRTFRRNVYLPDAAAGGAVRLEDLGFEPGAVNFFYSGAIDPSLAPNFQDTLRAIRQAPRARLHVCGPESEAVRRWFAELDVRNAHHYGRLDVATHDELARRCDVGLILYPSDNPYNHLTPTMKYTAYLANGLAILSTDLRSVRENLRADGVGRSLPIKELTVELLRWASRPHLFAEFKKAAEGEVERVRSDAEMRDWIEELAGEA